VRFLRARFGKKRTKLLRITLRPLSFVQNDQNIIPIMKLGEGFQLQFDTAMKPIITARNNHCDYN
jgi:hypothetical protein